MAELELTLSSALQNGPWTPALMADALRDMVAAGRIPPAVLGRLGLRDLRDATVARPAESPSNPRRPAATSTEPGDGIGPGQLLAGRYRLERKLGQGGMGIVYLATDEVVKGEVFAVKILSPEFREHPESLALLREEVRKTRSLAHPNIVGVYSLNVDRSSVFTLMEYLEGKTLQGLLDEEYGRGMRLDRAWPIIQDVSAALAYAHDRSVIHGDLKPANIFVTTSGKGKLLDFGIARAARGNAREKNAAVVGALTPAYASCEMLEYESPDTRDDIYALAVIFYEMLSGQHPFGGRSAAEARDEGAKPLSIGSLTEKQNVALARGLAFDRAARTPTVEMLRAGLASETERDKRHALTVAAFILVVASALALAYTVADKFWLAKHVATQLPTQSTADVPGGKSIAVLPFTDMSENKDQEYFSDGIAEEIIDLLVKVPELKVPARTSSFYFKGKPTQVPEIAKELGVAYVLEGSVRKSGNRLRVTVQLIRADSGYHLWSETYDRQLDDVFKVQDEIAALVVGALKATLPAAETTNALRTANTEAHEQYLLGTSFDREDTASGYLRAVEALRKAVALDPNYAAAYSRLAVAEADLNDMVGGDPASLQRAMAAADRAIDLAPNNADGYSARAYVNTWWLWDWDGARSDCDKALALEPNNSLALHTYSTLLMAEGLLPDAIAAGKKAIAIDPLWVISWTYLGAQLNNAGDFTQALGALRRALEIDPDHPFANFNIAVNELLSGHPDQALGKASAINESGWRLAVIASAQHSLGHPRNSQQALDELIRTKNQTDAYQIAEAYAWRGESDRAFTWLDRAYAQHDGGLNQVKTDALLASLRQDPRYKAFLQKMNLHE